MIEYKIPNIRRFEYISDVDIDVNIDIYVKEELLRHSEVKMKKYINHFTEIINDEDKKVLITDKYTQEVYCEFEINKENFAYADKYAYSYGENLYFLKYKYKSEEFLNGLRYYRPFILNLLRLTNCKSYLELGIEFIDNLSEVDKIVDLCVGVDINNLKVPENENYTFFNMTTDEFFEKNDNNFDIIFIDADHRYEQVKKDFENSLKVINEFGIILFHDTDPIDHNLLSDGCCSDSYKIVDYINLNYPELNVITLPILESGITMVMRKKDRRVNKFVKKI